MQINLLEDYSLQNRITGNDRRWSPVSRVTLIGTYAPRQCGIATFTQDLRSALMGARPSLAAPVAMLSGDSCRLHPGEVEYVVVEQERAAYAALRDELNASGTDVVSLQHEFGIFGGPDGAWILDTLRGLRPPMVTTCHTVLATPSPGQLQVFREICRLSADLVVMTAKGRELLTGVYGVPASKIAIIPHGIPDTDPASLDRDLLRRNMGWTGRKIMLTTGLLSPNKGLRHVIAALPRIVREHPDVMYVVAGATHPNLLRRDGEACRQELMDLAAELGVAGHVCFINRFASRDELVDMIVAADVFVTPYLNEAQITSGVLAYASGLGKPVISTPYWHARDLLDASRGVLVPFASPDGLAEEVTRLFGDGERLQRMSAAALAHGRQMTWSHTGRRYLNLFDEAAGMCPPAVLRRSPCSVPGPVAVDHLMRLTGPLGVFQHAAFEEPDPAHGYCTDDNARALIVAQDLQRTGHGDERLSDLRERCFGFLHEAYDVRSGRFHNFRSAAGNWLDDPGSEDSHGRALWALGHTARHASHPVMRRDAAGLFHCALPAVRGFTSPRAWAFTLLGLAALRTVDFANRSAAAAQAALAFRLVNLHGATAGGDWHWFEDVVTYDNARLPQALLVTAAQTGDGYMRAVAARTLAWLMHRQRAPGQYFRAIGCYGFFQRGDDAPAQWDQQPLEAQASLAACLAAYRLLGRRHWLTQAQRAFAWFEGANDAGLPVGDFQTGACRDGLHPGGLNLNCGAESTLAFLQAHADLRLFGIRPDLSFAAPAVRRNELYSAVQDLTWTDTESHESDTCPALAVCPAT